MSIFGRLFNRSRSGNNGQETRELHRQVIDFLDIRAKDALPVEFDGFIDPVDKLLEDSEMTRFSAQFLLPGAELHLLRANAYWKDRKNVDSRKNLMILTDTDIGMGLLLESIVGELERNPDKLEQLIQVTRTYYIYIRRFYDYAPDLIFKKALVIARTSYLGMGEPSEVDIMELGQVGVELVNVYKRTIDNHGKIKPFIEEGKIPKLAD